MATLFVNACVRGEKSRTLELCREYLDGMDNVTELNLSEMKLEPFYAGQVAYRAQLEEHGDFDDAIFDLSKQFAAADDIVIGAPYWDLSFPAVLKIYIEHVSVCDITFHYTEDARCVGKCKAKSITYISSCGGSVAGANLGYEYICGIAKMFGIPEVRFVCAENLDVVGVDIQAQMDLARGEIRKLRR